MEKNSTTMYLAVYLLCFILLVVGLIRYWLQERKRPPLANRWQAINKHFSYFLQDFNTVIAKHRENYGNVFAIESDGIRTTYLFNVADFPFIDKQPKIYNYTKFFQQSSVAVFKYKQEWVDNDELQSQVYRLYRQYFFSTGLDVMMKRMEQRIQKLLPVYFSTEKNSWKSVPLHKTLNLILYETIFTGLFGENMPYPVETAEEIFKIYSDNCLVFLNVVTCDKDFLNKITETRYQLAKSLKHQETSSEIIKQLEQLYTPFCQNETESNFVKLLLAMGSQGNTSSLAFWLFYFLLQEPIAMEKVMSEVNHFKNKENWMNCEVLDQMEILDSAIEEAMRLTNFSVMNRLVMQDTTLCTHDGKQYELKKGEVVCMQPNIIHFNEQLFPNPQEFKVDRFVGNKTVLFEGKKAPLKSFIYSFGSGVFVCPGRALSKNVIKVLFVKMTEHYEMQMDKRIQRPSLRMQHFLFAKQPLEDCELQIKPK